MTVDRQLALGSSSLQTSLQMPTSLKDDSGLKTELEYARFWKLGMKAYMGKVSKDCFVLLFKMEMVLFNLNFGKLNTISE